MTAVLKGRFGEDAKAGALHVVSIDWQRTLGHDEGSCIPIAFWYSEFLKARGWPARATECEVRVDDPVDAGYAEMRIQAPDEVAHMVVWIPTRRAVLDASLWTQRSRLLENLKVPGLLAGSMDHTIGDIGFRSRLGRGEITYLLHPKRKAWKKRSWPWEDLRDHAREMAKKNLRNSRRV